MLNSPSVRERGHLQRRVAMRGLPKVLGSRAGLGWQIWRGPDRLSGALSIKDAVQPLEL